jgi:hypothetical protein
VWHWTIRPGCIRILARDGREVLDAVRKKQATAGQARQQGLTFVFAWDNVPQERSFLAEMTSALRLPGVLADLI